jgi:hypothetical protein
MKQVLFSNWTFIRFLRLVMGLVIIGQGMVSKDALFGIAGFLFTVMALFNTGCCGSGGCYTATTKTVSKKSAENIPYEEVV